MQNKLPMRTHEVHAANFIQTVDQGFISRIPLCPVDQILRKQAWLMRIPGFLSGIDKRCALHKERIPHPVQDFIVILRITGNPRLIMIFQKPQLQEIGRIAPLLISDSLLVWLLRRFFRYRRFELIIDVIII